MAGGAGCILVAAVASLLGACVCARGVGARLPALLVGRRAGVIAARPRGRHRRCIRCLLLLLLLLLP